MKCPRCGDEGFTSVIEIEYATRTLLGGRTYFDEDGNYCAEDPNTTTTVMHCSNGHRLVRKQRGLEGEITVVE